MGHTPRAQPLGSQLEETKMSRPKSKLHRLGAGRPKWPASFLVGTTMAFTAWIGLAAAATPTIPTPPTIPTTPTVPSIPGVPTIPTTPTPGVINLSFKVTVSGIVTNSITHQGIPGVQVTFAGNNSYTGTTNASGQYSVSVGGNSNYTATFKAANYDGLTQSSLFVGTFPMTHNATLTPVAPVVVTASVSGTPTPGAAVTLVGSYQILDGSTLLPGYPKWTQSAGVPATISGTTATLGNTAAYKSALLTALSSPPLTPDQVAALPEWQQALNLDVSDFQSNGLQDRWQVVGINDWNLAAAEDGTFVYTVKTSSGTYSASAAVTAALPWEASTGLRTVPTGVGVLLYGKTQPSYAWTVVSAPPGSTVGSTSNPLMDWKTQAPYFAPDQPGVYEITEAVSNTTLTVHAGWWQGVIDPLQTLNSVLYGDGLPVADSSCTGCHRAGQVGPDGHDMDMFTPWRKSGHADIFTQNMTPPGNSTTGHYGPACFTCHTVGFDTDPAATNNGFDDQPGYLPYLSAGLINSGLNGWLYMLEGEDAQGNSVPSLVGLTRLANIQCENCHGPQLYTDAHGPDNSEGFDTSDRVSISSDVCGACHGEAPRHGRFQEWQISGHADYDLARSRGTRTTCTRCHSGQGFIMWTIKYGNDPDNNLTVPCTTVPNSPNYTPGSCDISWDEDTVHPQTCTTCHEGHFPGTTSGAANDATVRISGNTPMLAAGFQAFGVGTGAVCMTCHNSRRGLPLRDDADWVKVKQAGSSTITQGPHDGPQADMIEGQNAYFATIGAGAHASIQNTCNRCHMELSKAPLPIAPEAVNSTGTNHTFLADPGVCTNCHGSNYTAAGVQSQVSGLLTGLVTAMGNGYQRLMGAALPVTLPSSCGSVEIDAADQITSVTWSRSTRITIAYNTSSANGTCSNANPSDIQVTPASGTDGGATNLFLLSLTGSTTGPDGEPTPYPGPGNDGALLKAAWNQGIVNNDSSLGVHNHAFIVGALQNAITAVNNVAP